MRRGRPDGSINQGSGSREEGEKGREGREGGGEVEGGREGGREEVFVVVVLGPDTWIALSPLFTASLKRSAKALNLRGGKREKGVREEVRKDGKGRG